MKIRKYAILAAAATLAVIGCTQIDLNGPSASAPKTHMAIVSGIKVADGVQFSLSIPRDQHKTDNLPLCGFEVSGGDVCIFGPVHASLGDKAELRTSQSIPVTAKVQPVSSTSLIVATLPALEETEGVSASPDVLWQGARGEVTSKQGARNHILRWVAVENPVGTGKMPAVGELPPVELALPGLSVTLYSTMDMDHRF